MKPNVLIVFADQLRAQALGYMGDPNVKTPTFDKLAKESFNFTLAISTCPVCSPARASLLTGQYPLTHGVIINDVPLIKKGNISDDNHTVSIAEAFSSAGYDTGYIGKWHIDGSGCRSAFIPKERRLGFDYWKVLECTHDYNRSLYYENDSVEKKVWKEYDAIAQTNDACTYLKVHQKINPEKPFLLLLSWGPPHDPYQLVPEQFKKIYSSKKIVLRPNVPRNRRKQARKDLTGYYSHISALDWCMNKILNTLSETGLDSNTIVVFTSDHGDMLESLGQQKKQVPWDESIAIPLLIRLPKEYCSQKENEFTAASKIQIPISLMDLMPTMLGLTGIPIPTGVEGDDFSAIFQGKSAITDNPVLISCFWPFSNWRKEKGGWEYRGIRTRRYTYVRSLQGPWLLYDNESDPYQEHNLCNKNEYRKLQDELDAILKEKLSELGDPFSDGARLLKDWNYVVDKNGAVPYID